ncbi:peptidoglycan-binding protein [Archangium lansingense]|uniref:Peptidoglycan-binding protein n=1 Tax=Archangium lansingense TaxID=2995310 RepID=A0ABT4A6U3_9BACT|nr:peptidoglycan-binding protein [Archangium lansinium]MCY1077373.1 peptidoglycan-binding protein [Archangium lansinium]
MPTPTEIDTTFLQLTSLGQPLVLHKGSHGPLVIELQRRLIAAGFNPGPTDGFFGLQTEDAVQSFQQDRGMSVDGIVDSDTWRELGVHFRSPEGEAPEGPELSLEQLRTVMPNCSEMRATELLPHLNKAMTEADITTPQRQAAFLAQLAFVTGQLNLLEEPDSGEQYEGREDLGNVQPGDGSRYKGRGPLLLTGRANYRAAGKALGLDLENNPDLAANPEVGFRVAGWYWTSRDLNTVADNGDFEEVTRRFIGRDTVLPRHMVFYRRALAMLAH